MAEEVRVVSDGAYVEYLAAELGAMLLPEDYERLMAMARRSEEILQLAATVATLGDDAEAAYEAVIARLRARLQELCGLVWDLLQGGPPSEEALVASVRAARAALEETRL
jgi:hypothetical protein